MINMNKPYISTSALYGPYIAHHGIKGQKWGIRRFQNEDGTLTPEGRIRYGVELASSLKKYDHNNPSTAKAFKDHPAIVEMRINKDRRNALNRFLESLNSGDLKIAKKHYNTYYQKNMETAYNWLSGSVKNYANMNDTEINIMAMSIADILTDLDAEDLANGG